MKSRFVAIVPARGGSKGIPGKNLRKINGRPLIWYPLQSAKLIPVSCYISTDSQNILDAGIEMGYLASGLRDKTLASDTSLIVDVLKYEADRLSLSDEMYIILLQPSSPLINLAVLRSGMDSAVLERLDVVLTGWRLTSDFPSRLCSIGPNGAVDWLVGGGQASSRRQDSPEYFVRSGMFYIISVEFLRRARNLYDGRTGLIQIDKNEDLVIDTMNDLRKARRIIK